MARTTGGRMSCDRKKKEMSRFFQIFQLVLEAAQPIGRDGAQDESEE